MMPLDSFFDEIEKIGDIGSVMSAILGKTIQHPGQAFYRVKQVDEGVGRHKAMVNALERGYPAGWVALGMRPRG